MKSRSDSGEEMYAAQSTKKIVILHLFSCFIAKKAFYLDNFVLS